MELINTYTKHQLDKDIHNTLVFHRPRQHNWRTERDENKTSCIRCTPKQVHSDVRFVKKVLVITDDNTEYA